MDKINFFIHRKIIVLGGFDNFIKIIEHSYSHAEGCVKTTNYERQRLLDFRTFISAVYYHPEFNCERMYGLSGKRPEEGRDILVRILDCAIEDSNLMERKQINVLKDIVNGIMKIHQRNECALRVV